MVLMRLIDICAGLVYALIGTVITLQTYFILGMQHLIVLTWFMDCAAFFGMIVAGVVTSVNGVFGLYIVVWGRKDTRIMFYTNIAISLLVIASLVFIKELNADIDLGWQTVSLADMKQIQYVFECCGLDKPNDTAGLACHLTVTNTTCGCASKIFDYFTLRLSISLWTSLIMLPWVLLGPMLTIFFVVFLPSKKSVATKMRNEAQVYNQDTQAHLKDIYEKL